jgi:BirA family biotin operon repressor/biotin-[acetyl-CoA-carboxylase] ligase
MDIKWKIDYIAVLDSTNEWINQHLMDGNEVTEGYGIRAGFQNAGRGQRGNHWESEKDKNILLSFVLKTGLPVKRQFLISQIISLAIAEYLVDHDLDKVSIKWPNDIYVGDKKIAGILIQNILKGSTIEKTIVGIGLNINQEHFYSDAPNPTSLTLATAKKYNLELELVNLLDCISKNYTELFTVRKAKPQNMYRFLLYRLNVKSSFMDKEGNLFEGIIKGVDDLGNLEIERAQGIEHFGFKEIKYII